jgi:hypothetical protein
LFCPAHVRKLQGDDLAGAGAGIAAEEDRCDGSRNSLVDRNLERLRPDLR